MKLLRAIAFLGTVLAANYATTHLGMVPVGFGLMATAGTYLVGVTFILRDVVQDHDGKRWTVALIVAGALLSFAVADPVIALASASAFAISELADYAVYTPLRRRKLLTAIVLSNLAGSILDTIVFLAVAGFPIGEAFPGQIAGKLAATGLAVAVVLTVRKVKACSTSETLAPRA